MVCEWGMSDKLGPLTFGKKEEHIFLGKDMGQRKDFSEETAVEIDTEIKKIVVENYTRARKLLESHTGALHRLAKALLEKEGLDGPEIERLIYLEDGGTAPSGTPEPAGAKPETLNPEDAASLGVAAK